MIEDKHPYLHLDEDRHQWVELNPKGKGYPDAVYGECGECGNYGDIDLDDRQRLKSYREGYPLVNNICFRCFNGK